MNGVAVIQASLNSTAKILNWFLSDFTDDDMLVRPLDGANHAAWQVGNVIAADVAFIRSQWPEAPFPELPAGFEEIHGSKGTTLDGAVAGFLTRDQYVDLFTRTRAATVAAVGQLSDADLDRPTTGDLASMAPTIADLLLLVSNHTLMHAGQLSVIRRKLNKPVLV